MTKKAGSSALSGKMLDLELLKKSEGMFYQFLAPVGGSAVRDPILVPFLILQEKSNLYLTYPDLK